MDGEIKIVPAYDLVREVRELFAEYTAMLIEGDPVFREYLSVQNYDEEFSHLEDKYGLPGGRLYVAYCSEKPAGCIGLKKIDERHCEMKRFYVRPAYRGKRIGDRLVRQVISDAKEAGYLYMRLDTLPFLESAVRMYRKYGFYEIPKYNDSPMDTAIYMELVLRR